VSRWRREASERLPEYQSLIASTDVDNPMMLWIELQIQFSRLCEQKPPPLELLRRFWGYAGWCMEHGHPFVATAAALAFCEHLLQRPATRLVLPPIMTRLEYLEIKALMLYHGTEEDFVEVLNRFEAE
jgi:hypothetical protein